MLVEFDLKITITVLFIYISLNYHFVIGLNPVTSVGWLGG